MRQSNGQFARTNHYGHPQVREMSADVSRHRFHQKLCEAVVRRRARLNWLENQARRRRQP
jgi:hypothetical protein